MCLLDYVNDPFIPQRGRRGQTMATAHSNGRESTTDIARHIHQVTSSSADQLPPQQQQQRLRDRVDDNANFRRFLRRLLKPNSLASTDTSDHITGNDTTEDTIDDEESLELKSSPAQSKHTWLPAPMQSSPNSQHNLSPTNSMQQQTSSTITLQPTHHWVSQQRNASRDTFYLARGSLIRQRQIQ